MIFTSDHGQDSESPSSKGNTEGQEGQSPLATQMAHVTDRVPGAAFLVQFPNNASGKAEDCPKVWAPVVPVGGQDEVPGSCFSFHCSQLEV